MSKNHKRHRIKEDSYINIVLMTSTSKEPIQIRFAKWLKYPFISCTAIVIGLASFKIYEHNNYKQDLEIRINTYASQVSELENINATKAEQIASLEEINEKNHSNLESIKTQTEELIGKFNKLQEEREEIQSKLDSSEKSTNTKPRMSSASTSSRKSTEFVSESQYPETALDAENLSGDLHTSNFEDDILLLTQQISLAEANINGEIDSMKNLEDEVDTLIPYWDAYPSIMPTKGWISSGYGWRKNPTGYGSEFHKGLDIANSYGSNVYATGKGTVIQSGYVRGYGYVVYIDHGYGISTRYAHNSKLLVHVGDHVDRGDIIAKVGSTGNSTGPHVHYEVRKNNQPQNPMNYLYKGGK